MWSYTSQFVALMTLEFGCPLNMSKFELAPIWSDLNLWLNLHSTLYATEDEYDKKRVKKLCVLI